MYRSTLLAALLAVTTAAPAFSSEAGFQPLGLWQEHIGEGVTYGEPPAAGSLLVVDPVAAVPVSRRPAPRPVATTVAAPVAVPRPVALKPEAKQSLNEAVKAPPVVDLMARRYDAEVPMPHPDLEGYAAPSARLNRPQPYVRGTDHGAVLGVRVPLSANRAPATTNSTRSSGALNGLDGGFGR